jgi:hypothetical protein
LNSRDLYNQTDFNRSKLSNVAFTLNEPLRCRANESFVLTLKQAVIPYSWYGINEKNNKFKIQVQDNDGENAEEEIFISIPLGNWSIVSLIKYLQTYINNLISFDITMTYNDIANKVKITSNSQTKRLKIDFTINDDAHECLGFSDEIFYLYGNMPLLSNEVVQIFNHASIYIKTNLLGGVAYLQEGTTNILANIPINTIPMGIINFNDTMKYILHQKSINFIEIEMVFEDFSEIDFNGKHWQIALQIDTIYNREFKHERSDLPEILKEALNF